MVTSATGAIPFKQKNEVIGLIMGCQTKFNRYDLRINDNTRRKQTMPSRLDASGADLT